MAKQYWLMKSEPGDYSIDDLEADGTTYWDGVRNYQARNLMRDEMAVGDRVLFYHSNAKPPAVVGVAEIARTAYPDHTQFDPDDKHFDPKSDPDNPRWSMVDVEFVSKVADVEEPLSLHDIKADPKLELSPPKKPIRFFIEKTVPVKYRRYVKDGILEWNKAFEKVGILDAIEVVQQTETNEHKDKNPEDIRYNFFRWIYSQNPFAMGPSRVDPRTGQILDADIVMDEGFISSYVNVWKKLIPEAAMQNFGPETLAWLATRPEYDPRVLLAAPSEREQRKAELAHHHATHGLDFAGHPAASADPTMIGDDPFDGFLCVRHQRFLYSGCRFSMKAAIPSLASAVAISSSM